MNIITFDKLNVGDTAEIVGFSYDSPDYLSRLLALGLTRGTLLTVVRVAPLGDPVAIEVRGFMLSLRKNEGNILKVRRCSKQK